MGRLLRTERGILLVSIENLVQHWRVLGRKSDLGCGLVAGTAVAQIQKRTIALNDIMARVCYRTTGCLFDAGARYRMALQATTSHRLTRAGFRRMESAP